MKAPAGRGRRRVVRLLLLLAALPVVLTLVCLLANALTTPPPTLAAPDGRDLQIGGRSVHVREWGSGGSPVVLVHGFAESTVVWAPAADRLARHHRVVAVDLEGWGYTQRSGRYSLDDQVALVDGVITSLHLDRPMLVGHSMGAAVVGGVALAHPQDVRGVIFADGDGLPFRPSEDGARQRNGPPGWILRSPWFVSGYRLATGWPWLSERIVRGQCGSRCLAVTPELVRAWMRPMRSGEAEDALEGMSQAGVSALTPTQVRQIRVPRGIVWGAEDPTSGGSLALAQQYLGHPPTIVIPGAGHLSMVADPDAFAAAVERLTTTVDPRGR